MLATAVVGGIVKIEDDRDALLESDAPDSLSESFWSPLLFSAFLVKTWVSISAAARVLFWGKISAFAKAGRRVVSSCPLQVRRLGSHWVCDTRSHYRLRLELGEDIP